MAIKLGFSLLFFFCSTFLLPALSSTNPGDMNWWCNKTPHPGSCLYYLTSQQDHIPAPIRKQEFRNTAVQMGMMQALEALDQIRGLGPKSLNEKENAAWSNCLKLYERTIFHLNQTLDNTMKHTDFDIQTWLSSALTNLDTCRTGFIEYGVTENILPLMSNNVSVLISNSLAINGGSSEEQTYKKGFPTWLSNSDRRLVQLVESIKPNLVVAKDGSGNFSTIKEALDATAKCRGYGRYVIHVKEGVYDEYIQVTRNMTNIMMTGDGINMTVITGNRSHGGGSTTIDSATFSVHGSGFIARGITFRNTAGPANEQAVALVSLSDFSVFYQCSFDGYQDTLYVHSNRQFYKECNISGTVDFIFGNAAAVFQNCVMYARTPMQGQKNMVTAQGRTDPRQNTGISIHNSRVVTSSRTYLGRPWKEYSRTVFMQTYLDSLVDPAGWFEWQGVSTKNLYYGEYNNSGPGSSTTGRVKWDGYRVIKVRAEAENFTVANFIGGQSWLPTTGVPFIPGL